MTPPETEKGFGSGLRSSIERKRNGETAAVPEAAVATEAEFDYGFGLTEPTAEEPVVEEVAEVEPEPTPEPVVELPPDLGPELEVARAELDAAKEQLRAAREEQHEAARAVAEKEGEIAHWAEELDRKQVKLAEPIKEAGSHLIPVKLHADVEFPVTLEVSGG